MVDDHAANIRDRLLVGENITNTEDRTRWARLLFSLMHRNPDRMVWLREEWQKSMRAVDINLKQNYDSIRRPQDPLTYEEMLAQSDPHASDKSFSNLASGIMDSRLVGTHLINMKWFSVDVAQRYPLLTSDRPLLMTNGMRQPLAHIALALSPRVLFIAVNDQPTLTNLLSHGRELAAKFNNHILSIAKDYAYSDGCKLRGFVNNRLKRIPQTVHKGVRVPTAWLDVQGS